MLTDLERDTAIAALYSASSTPRMVEVPEMTYLMIDGHGEPAGADYGDAVRTLYSLSFALRAAMTRAGGIRIAIAPLEGLRWSGDRAASATADTSSRQWTAMIRQPSGVTSDLWASIAEDARDPQRVPALERVRLDSLVEGRAGQILHVGPASAEAPTIRRLHAFLAGQGYHVDGLRQQHHEIHLGDPRRDAPEHLRTIIRQPVA
jgi:hypothetical protein